MHFQLLHDNLIIVASTTILSAIIAKVILLMEVQMQKQNLFGMIAVIGASTLWAIAANVASSLMEEGVKPFELAGVSIMLATLGLMAVNLLRRQPIFRVPSLPQIGLSALFAIDLLQKSKTNSF